MTTYNFPKRFLWGASTSAHQVEGGTHNQWTVWELENAMSLAKAAEYRLGHLPIWSAIKDQASNPANYISGEATDHYHRFERDFDIVKAMHLNAFRFSIEWSRLEPEEGKWDVAEMQHYRDYIAALKKRGLEPMVTLFHWTLPVWFVEKGGFEKARNIKYFVRYAEKVLGELGNDLRYITTINEPDTVVTHGYITLDHPPQKASYLKAFWVYRNLLVAHKRIYRLGRRMSRRFKIGFTKSYAYIYAGDERRMTYWATRLDYWARDDLVLAYVGRKTDFIGVNYYFSDRHVGIKFEHNDERENDLGWGMRPEHLEHVLRRLGKRHKNIPLIVTESGVADMSDKYRKWWIVHSIQAIHNALKAGVQIEGYLHWSLLDNFEWAYGKWPRFGLIAIDYETKKRTPRASAKFYAQTVKKMRGL